MFQVAAKTNISNLPNTLTVFVKECRNKLDEIKVNNAALNRREVDSSWVADYLVYVYSSIKCWRPDSKDLADLKR